MIKYFLNNRISAFIIAMFFLLAGVISIGRLPVSLVPSADYPAVTILIEYPGVDPEIIERIITKPVERVIKGTGGITEIYSVSEEGRSKINITFDEKSDIKIASLKLRERIELIREQFPDDVQEPVVYRYDPSEKPVIIAAARINGMSCDDVREIVEKRIKPALQRIDGVSEINIAGGSIKEIHVDADRYGMEARGITFQDIAHALRSSNFAVPGGFIDSCPVALAVHIPSGFDTISDIGGTAVFTGINKWTNLREFAETTFTLRGEEDLSRFNGEDLVTIYIHKGGGGNALGICEESEKLLRSFSGIDFEIIFNQGEHIGKAVDNAVFSGLWGVFIVLVVLSLFFRKREMVIPIALSIPCSILAVPLFLYLDGRGINVMSLSGFALSTGMVVDNGIVIIDIISGSEDSTPNKIIAAVSSVKNTVISSTLTTISVFAPVAYISTRAESLYGDMAFTVNRALIISLFTAIIIVPSFYITIRNMSGLRLPVFMHIENFEITKRILRFSEYAEKKTLHLYRGILYRLLEKKSITLSSAAAFLLFIVILCSFMDADSVSDNDRSEFYLYIELPTGTALKTADMEVRKIENIASSLEGVISISSKVEKWRGILTVKTDPSLAYRKREILKQILKDKADIILRELRGFSYISEADELATKDITIHFLGDDIDTLKKLSREAASKIRNINGFDECYLRFREGRPEYRLDVDRNKCRMSGITVTDVAQRLHGGLFGPVITKFIGMDREIDVRLRHKASDRENIHKALSGTVTNSQGQPIPITEIVSWREDVTETGIYRLNGRRSLSITAGLKGITLQDGENRIRSILEKLDIPQNYSFEFDRKLVEIKKERVELSVSVLVSILLIYMILASLFESLTLPLLIMVTIPFAVAGAVPLLIFTSTPLSPSVYMGFILLSGIVVNSGILLVETVNREYHSGRLNEYNLKSIVLETSFSRFRPVMLTVISTVFGMLPMLFGGGEGSMLWFPFALTVVSGMVVSTVFTLLLLPILGLSFFEMYVKKTICGV